MAKKEGRCSTAGRRPLDPGDLLESRGQAASSIHAVYDIFGRSPLCGTAVSCRCDTGTCCHSFSRSCGIHGIVFACGSPQGPAPTRDPLAVVGTGDLQPVLMHVQGHQVGPVQEEELELGQEQEQEQEQEQQEQEQR